MLYTDYTDGYGKTRIFYCFFRETPWHPCPTDFNHADSQRAKFLTAYNCREEFVFQLVVHFTPSAIAQNLFL